jgi:rare lipoprotein A (peptidoglycan hydrolase)
MQEGHRRHGRQDSFRIDRETGRRRARGARLAALLSAVTLLAATTAVSAQAFTGGASSVAWGGAEQTGEGLAFSSPMQSAGATWYGPGLYGNRTACGQTLRPGTIGVAHRSLPCGTTIKFTYHGHSLITRVIDRGPYTTGNSWDLTNGARLALGFNGAGQVHYAVALSYARHQG